MRARVALKSVNFGGVVSVVEELGLIDGVNWISSKKRWLD